MLGLKIPVWLIEATWFQLKPYVPELLYALGVGMNSNSKYPTIDGCPVKETQNDAHTADSS